ncbi:hypothetical protein [Mycobacterium sp.]
MTEPAAEGGRACLRCQQRDDDPVVPAGADLSNWLAGRMNGL